MSNMRKQHNQFIAVGLVEPRDARQRIDARPYAERRPWVSPVGYGVSIEPVEGFYRTRLRMGGIQVGIRIWFGPPHEPWTGEEMDRSHRWQAECNGRYIEFDRVWPSCAKDPINAEEYDYLSSLQAWGEKHEPDGAIADPTRKIDPLHTPLLF